MSPHPLPIALAVAIPLAAASAADWPQWRGPDRSGVSAETGWLERWPKDAAPRVAWRVQVGRGHSAVSVAAGRAYTLGWDGKRDTVWCLDAATGAVIWKRSYDCKGIGQWSGPRATPVVHDGTVYTLGQHGQLNAWSAADGAPRWSVQLPESYNPDVDYGFAWSPLPVGDRLILGCGSKGVAVRTEDGSFAWGHDGRHGACASPVPFEHGGRPAAAIVTTTPGRDSVVIVGVDAADGRELWRSPPWPEKWGAACVDPVVRDGKVFLTTSEQHPRCVRFAIDGGRLREDWSNNHLACYTGGCVLLAGRLYAVNRRGLLKCLDWATGREVWSQRGFDGHGALIAADGKLIIQTSKSGQVVVAAADPAGYRELRRAKVFEGPADTFTAPALSGGRLYCRSYAGEVVCLAP